MILASAGEKKLYAKVFSRTEIQLLTVVVFYDNLLTLPLESSLIWRGKVNLMKILFYLNRYAVLSMVIVLLIKDNIPSIHVCDPINIVLFLSVAI